MADLVEGRRLIAEVRLTHANAENLLGLARAVCLAVVVEPRLLRAARKLLVPLAGVETESDLWFSPLVVTRNATGFVFGPDARAALREELQRDPGAEDFISNAHSLIVRTHGGHSRIIRIEEELAYLSLGEPDEFRNQAEHLLRPVVKAVVAGGTGRADVVNWVAQAWRRLPEALSTTEAGQLLWAAASLRLRRPIGGDQISLPRFPSGLASFRMADTHLSSRVGVQRTRTGIRFVEDADSVPVLEVPATDPPVVEVSWRSDDREHRRVVTARPGSSVDLNEDATAVAVQSLAGRRYLLQSSIPAPAPANYSGLADDDGIDESLTLDAERRRPAPMYERINPSRMQVEADDLVRRFGGRCPVCLAFLGAVPPTDPITGRFTKWPSLRLEVCPKQASGASPWRISIVGRPLERLGVPTFLEEDIQYTYLLCGNGHLFNESTVFRPEVSRFSVDVWNPVAIIGGYASGKTYLTTRVLQQSLHNTRSVEYDHMNRIRLDLYEGTPIERLPLENRQERYRDTLIDGRELPPTSEEGLLPRDLLMAEVSGDLVDAITDLFEGNVDPGVFDEGIWGRHSPQPIVVRTRSEVGRQARYGWTCVADLWGEFFDEPRASDPPGVRERTSLRNYGALVWVFDPVVETETFDSFARPVRTNRGGEVFDRLLRGSLMPLSLDSTVVGVARRIRQESQRSIMRRIALIESELISPANGRSPLLIAISKVDTLWAALKEGADLDQFGEPRQVRVGIARYLQHIGQKSGSRTFPDHACVELLRLFDPREVVDRRERLRRLDGLARDIATFYSDPTNFWNLVHGGRAARIPFQHYAADSSSVATHALNVPSIVVPSIDQHVDVSLRTGRSPDGQVIVEDLLRMRDLVMSALGCGLMFGMGYGAEVSTLLDRDWVDLKFFPCSALAAEPDAARDGVGIMPQERGAHFAELGDRSAALTQLWLGMLQRVL